ncbi:MAG: SUMF1/EgtB/PvdO family nonheme iron enzyme [Hyphomicrobiaceae bacterium]|nr:SUMF1/EgtB/PvdO family nonheme iron enzyme [Hyphomicrobiaceae bacterium]
MRIVSATAALAGLLFVTILCGGAPQVAAETAKFALLIGNSSYPNAPLKTPVNDAKLLAETLRKQNFKVDIKTNLRKSEMRAAVREFADGIEAGSIAFVFFSGYGLSSVGETFMVPVDAQIGSEKDLWGESISLKTVLNWLEKKRTLATVVVIDGARRFPDESRFRSSNAGLVPDIGAVNTLTIYSASPGQIIESGKSDESVFGRQLAEQLGNTENSATEAFNRVRLGVARETNGAQIPLVTSTLAQEIHFATSKSRSTEDGREQKNAGETVEPSSRAAERSNERSGASAGPSDGAKSGKGMRDCPDCPDLVVVPAGSFSMGSNQPYQRPSHTVSFARPFAIGRYEVTFEEWDVCVADGACERPSDLGWGRGRIPVVNVSWADAQKYVAWLSKKTRQTYRLPSEAEWEYAARGGGADTAFWWGAVVGVNNANCRGCSAGASDRARPVGSFAANRYGLFDTAGNVAEWVEDCWNDSYRNAPGDGTAWREGDCNLRVLRGGSFDSGAAQVQSSARFRYDAYVPYSANGFRVVRELK